MSTPRPKQTPRTPRTPKAYTEKMLKGTVPWPLHLKVGGWYQTRDGFTVFQIRAILPDYGRVDHDRRWWLDGHCCPSGPSKYDLVREVRIMPVPSKGRRGKSR